MSDKRGLSANSFVTDLFGRMRIAARAGLQAGGLRDLYQVFGWTRQVDHASFVAKYLRQDVAQRVIDAPVNALWTDPPILESDDAFMGAWQDLLAGIQVFTELMNADKLAGLGRYSLLVVGFDDGKQLETPLTYKEGRKVIYMQPYSEGSTQITQWETSQTSPRFGLPVAYRVQPGSFIVANQQATQTAIATRSFDVHHSRVLHLVDGRLESRVFGHSRLEPVYNVLDDIMKVGGGSAEMFWLAANRGLHVNVDKEMDLQEGDAEALSEEIEEYANQLRRVIRTRGVDVKSLGSDISDPRGTFDIQMSLLAATTGIPKRVLMGSEAGQLASQQDRANWSQRIEERVVNYGQPVVMLPFLRMMINAGVLPKPSKMVITWPDAFKMNPLERAQTSAQMARSAANLSRTLKTVSDINKQNAESSRSSVEAVSGGGGFGGGMAFNAADPKAKPAKSGSDPAAVAPKPESYGSVTTDLTDKEIPPGMLARPPLTPQGYVHLELLSEDECRSIIGFGRHMPVFDEKADSNIVAPK